MGILWKTSILMVLIVSGFSAISYSQTYSLGVGLNYAPAEISNGVGLNSVFEYRTDIHYAYRLNLRAVLGSFEDKYYPGMSYFLPGLEGSFVYYPVKWPIEPYFGAGIGYFYPITTGLDGNTRDTPDGWIVGSNIKSSYGLNALAGLKLSADTPISLLLEFKYNYFRPNVTHEFSTPIHHFKDDKVEWSSLITSLSIIFKI
jgi:hypothetical protein